MENTKKIALITGASRGIGKAIALQLSQDGFIVIGTATTESGAAAITQYLESSGGIGMPLEVTNKDSIDSLVKQVSATYGDILVLVNNAGITKDGLLLRMKEEDFDSVVDTNLKSVFLLSKAVIRGMTKAHYGRIINIASIVAFTGNPGQVNYSASKGGLVAMTKSLAREFASRNITANVVAPGFIETDMTNSLSAETKAEYYKNIPLARFGTPQEIASSVSFLASDKASYITGNTIHVNGGLYM